MGDRQAECQPSSWMPAISNLSTKCLSTKFVMNSISIQAQLASNRKHADSETGREWSWIDDLATIWQKIPAVGTRDSQIRTQSTRIWGTHRQSFELKEEDGSATGSEDIYRRRQSSRGTFSTGSYNTTAEVPSDSRLLETSLKNSTLIWGSAISLSIGRRNHVLIAASLHSHWLPQWIHQILPLRLCLRLRRCKAFLVHRDYYGKSYVL